MTSSKPKYSARAHHVQRLRQYAAVDEEGVRLGLRHPARHRHRLGGSGRLVEQRRVGHRQPGQVDHHLLVVEQRLEAALRDLGLVRRVRGIPARVFQHVAQDHVGQQGRMVAQADEGLGDGILGGHLLEGGQCLHLGHRGGQRERAVQADRGGDGLADQLVEAGDAQLRAHGGAVGVVRPDMAADEFFVVIQLFERHQAWLRQESDGTAKKCPGPKGPGLARIRRRSRRRKPRRRAGCPGRPRWPDGCGRTSPRRTARCWQVPACLRAPRSPPALRPRSARTRRKRP